MTQIDIFKLKVKRMFLNSRNKRNLFASLREQLRRFLELPKEYIMFFLETLSEPMPLHAAVSAEYFRQHGLFCEEITDFISNLCVKCEENFMNEMESSDLNLNKCADLHTTFSYLKSENIEISISKAVQQLSEAQRENLFREVGRCVSAVHDISQEERDLLDPILKYFSVSYPEEINKDFLSQNKEEFSDLIPKDEIISELLVNAVKNNHFHYFTLLYDLFPNWKCNQKNISSDEFIDLSFDYASQEENRDNLLYLLIEPSLSLAYHGHTYLKKENLEQWYRKINERSENYPFWEYAEPDISYIYYCCNITECGIVRETVEKMPYFKPDSLIYACHDVDIKILQEDTSLLKLYLDKIGENNRFRYDSEYILPDVVPVCGVNYDKLIQNLGQKHSAEEILYFYFHTTIRGVVPPWRLFEILRYDIPECDFTDALDNYVFMVGIKEGKLIYLPFCSDVGDLYFIEENTMNGQIYAYQGITVCPINIKLKSLRLFKAPIVMDLSNIDSEVSISDGNCIIIEIIKKSEDDENYIWLQNTIKENFADVIAEIVNSPQEALKYLTAEQAEKVREVAQNPQYNNNYTNYAWHIKKAIDPEGAVWSGIGDSYNKVIDIQETACLAADIQGKDLILLETRFFKGKLRKNDLGKFEFLPDENELLCKNAPIILDDAYSSFAEDYENLDEIDFYASISVYDRVNNVFYAAAYPIGLYSYISDKVRKLSNISVEKSSISTDFKNWFRLLHDKAWILNYFGNIEGTVIKALKDGKIKDILTYLDNIEETNVLHNGNEIYVFRKYYEIILIQISEGDKSKYVEMLFKKAPTEVISRIFRDTPLRFEIPFEKWCQAALKYGKLNDFIDSLNDFEFVIYRNSWEEFIKDCFIESLNFEKKYYESSVALYELIPYCKNVQNVSINSLFVDETPELKPLSDGYTKYRIVGYDAENKTAILEKITSE